MVNSVLDLIQARRMQRRVEHGHYYLVQVKQNDTRRAMCVAQTRRGATPHAVQSRLPGGAAAAHYCGRRRWLPPPAQLFPKSRSGRFVMCVVCMHA